MDLQKAFNETNFRLRNIQDALCCQSGSYNNLEVLSLSGSSVKVFLPSTVHSVSWNLGTGASVNIQVDSNAAVSFTKEGAIQFSGLNINEISIESVGGITSLIWTY